MREREGGGNSHKAAEKKNMKEGLRKKSCPGRRKEVMHKEGTNGLEYG